jgi:hypothetical protein
MGGLQPEVDEQSGEDRGCSLRLVGEVWHVRYRGEAGDYPAKGNLCIGWLVKLLAVPNRLLTVADLRGDPEGKLAADAVLGAERVADPDDVELKAIKKELDDIEATADLTEWTEGLEERKANLLRRLQGRMAERLGSQLQRGHANIATQLRNLRRKLERDMPQLVAHLKVSLKLDFPEFGYYPPDPPPNWQF